jgi:hypothetical protein
MGQVSLINGVQFAGYGLELSLLVLLLSRKRIRRFPALCAYVASLFAVDAVGRGWVLQHYGRLIAVVGSHAHRVYFYSYYLSDLVLALGMFLLVCTFFRRACRDHQKVWEFIRPILTWILLLVIVASAVALRAANVRHPFSVNGLRYIYEFNQDLYFVCLVLNTVLYLMLQRFKVESDLNLLVCGLGVQLAGPAAGSALAYLIGSQTVLTYLSPLCGLAMMVIWVYAIGSTPSSKSEGTGGTNGRRTSKRYVVSPAMQLKPVPAVGGNRRMVAGPNTLQAGYIHG